jgi:hypothetical protein
MIYSIGSGRANAFLLSGFVFSIVGASLLSEHFLRLVFCCWSMHERVLLATC